MRFYCACKIDHSSCLVQGISQEGKLVQGRQSSRAALGRVTFNYDVTSLPHPDRFPLAFEEMSQHIPTGKRLAAFLACNTRTVNSEALIGSNVGTKLSLLTVSVPHRRETALCDFLSHWLPLALPSKRNGCVILLCLSVCLIMLVTSAYLPT
jgi:hypothetical protein